jgi:putative nucleotidyltransferase with HDIG domain
VALPDRLEVVLLAESLLGSLGDRWQHTQAVARRAWEVAGTVPREDVELLIAAAWLHDVGYAPATVATGFHPLDGARFLHREGYPERLCGLVAHHSGARFEAAERGLADELGEYPLEESPVMDALVTADFTIGPQGQNLSYDERVEEILRRYPPGSAVSLAVMKSRSELARSVERVWARQRKAVQRLGHVGRIVG